MEHRTKYNSFQKLFYIYFAIFQGVYCKNIVHNTFGAPAKFNFDDFDFDYFDPTPSIHNSNYPRYGTDLISDRRPAVGFYENYPDIAPEPIANPSVKQPAENGLASQNSTSSHLETVNDQLLAFLRLLQEDANRRFGDLTPFGAYKFFLTLFPIFLPVIYLPFLLITSLILFYPLQNLDAYIRNEEKNLPTENFINAVTVEAEF